MWAPYFLHARCMGEVRFRDFYKEAAFKRIQWCAAIIFEEELG
jgi:hypothetical protein